MIDVTEMPDLGSHVRKAVREKAKGADEWKRLDAWFAAVGNADHLLRDKRNEVARLESEAATIRSQVANRKRDEAVALVDPARVQARKIIQDARDEVAGAMARFKNL